MHTNKLWEGAITERGDVITAFPNFNYLLKYVFAQVLTNAPILVIQFQGYFWFIDICEIILLLWMCFHTQYQLPSWSLCLRQQGLTASSVYSLAKRFLPAMNHKLYSHSFWLFFYFRRLIAWLPKLWLTTRLRSSQTVLCHWKSTKHTASR